MIPNFVGADIAAWRLAQTAGVASGSDGQDQSRRAANPDPSPRPVRGQDRLRAGAVSDESDSHTSASIRKTHDREGHRLRARRDVAGLRGARRAASSSRTSSRSISASSARSRWAAPGGRTGKGARLRRSRDGDLSRARHRHRRRRRWRPPCIRRSWSPMTRVVIEAARHAARLVATEPELIRTGNHHAASRAASTGTACARTSSRRIPFLASLRDRMLGLKAGAEHGDQRSRRRSPKSRRRSRRYEQRSSPTTTRAARRFFLDEPTTIRYGVADIAAWQSTRSRAFRASPSGRSIATCATR